jgi:cyclohexyl-isocyanide hydratase
VQTPEPLLVNMVLFPSFTQLDLTGAYEVLARLPGARVSLVAATTEPVRTEFGLTITPDATFAAALAADIVCVPGGWAITDHLDDDEMLDFLRAQAKRARYVTSVCTGALLLGAAGLLRGYRATTHWQSLEMLRLFGAEPVNERVVVDRDRVTGGGVTAGIDFGLAMAAELFGATVAQEIQLAIEYHPAPPFDSGSPDSAPEAVRDAIVQRAASALAQRRARAESAAKRLG